jgi:carbonic anhydrase/acetyltransferase-like protein (isoleucine patch superfamily)
MTIKTFADYTPDIHPSAWVDDMAYVSGRTTLAEDSSVWPMAVLRGDVNSITVGKRSNIQDGAVLHVTHDGPFTRPGGIALIIGDDVTVGHKAVLHACSIGNRCLIGMNATVLDGAVIADETIIAAGSLVPPGKQLESGYLWTGSPVKKARPLTDKELAWFTYSAEHYVKLAKRTRDSVQG